MTHLSVQQRALLELIRANHARGLVPAARTMLPTHVSRVLNNLRLLGLVEQGSFRPVLGSPLITAAMPPERPARRLSAPRPGSWTAERKQRFLDALASSGRVDRAVASLGIRNKAGAYAARRADPAFAARWDALAVGRRGIVRTEVADTAPAPFAAPDDELETPRRPRLPDPAGQPDPDPAPQRAGDRPGQGVEPPLAPLAAADRGERLGHHRLEPGRDRQLNAAADPVAAPLQPDPAPDIFRTRPDAEICEQALAHRDEQRRIALARPGMSPQEAQRLLQSRGLVVYRASVAGGRSDRWFCSGLGRDVTDEQLVAKAEAVEARRMAA